MNLISYLNFYPMNKKILVSVVIFLVALVVVFFAIRKPLAESLNQKGLDSYNRNEYIPAEKYFKKSLKWNSKSAVTGINLVKSLLAQNKTEEAGSFLDKLNTLFPEHPEKYALEGQKLVMEDEFEKGIRKLNLAIEKDSMLSYAYYYRGIAKANLNDLNGAADDYLKARKLDQDNTDILIEGAIVLSKLENFDAAIENYNKILELDPSNTEAFLNRGNFKMKILDFKGSVSDFSNAISLDDQLAEAYFNRGKSYANLGIYDKAIDDFNKAIQFNHKIASANYNSGLAYLKLNKPGEAKKYLTNCIKYDSESEHTASAYYLLGIMEMMQNRNEEAIKYFTNSLKFDANRADTYYNRGIANGLMNRPQEAIDDLNNCLDLGMKSADVYFALGVQKISMNNFADGCSNLKTSAEMGNQRAVQMRVQYCKNY